MYFSVKFRSYFISYKAWMKLLIVELFFLYTTVFPVSKYIGKAKDAINL